MRRLNALRMTCGALALRFSTDCGDPSAPEEGRSTVRTGGPVCGGNTDPAIFDRLLDNQTARRLTRS